MKYTKKIRTVGVALLAATALVLTACSSAAPAPAASKDGGKPALEQTSLKFSYSASVQQLEKVPLHMAISGLDKVGITDAEEAFHQSGEDAVQAVARGESDFGVANAPTVFAAIKKGAPIQAVMGAYYPAYLVVATKGVKDVCGLDGKRVGIHAKVSATTLYTNLALQQCPSAKPEILIVPGSAARVQAMLAGQLDASAVQFADWLALQKQAPGRFEVVFDVAKEDLGILDSVIFTSKATIKQKPVFVRTFVQAVQAQYADVYGDEAGLAKAIEDTVPDMTANVATELAKTSIEDKLWPADGGFSDATIKATLGALKDSGLLDAETLPTAAECCTASFLK